MTLSTSW